MSQHTTSALLGAVVMTALSLLPRVLPIPAISGCLGCLLLFSGGLFAVWHYTNAERVTMRSGDAARLGVQTGLIAFVLGAVLLLVTWLFAGTPDLTTFFADQMQKGMASNPQSSPEAAEMVDNIIGWIESNLGLVIVLGSVLSILFNVLGSVLGAILGAAIFKKGGNVAAEDTY